MSAAHASPSFKFGMTAAREASEREAAALRAEAEALRDANARLLKEAAGLRAENHDLMQDLRQSDYGITPGLTARQAASQMRCDMEDLREAAEEAAEMAAAEKVARAELIRRNERLANEARSARTTAGKLFAAGAVTSVLYALAKNSSATSSSSPDSSTSSSSSSSPSVSSMGAYAVALVMALWAAVFSRPAVAVTEATLPIDEVALVDEEDVEMVQPAVKPAKKDAKKDAKNAAAEAKKKKMKGDEKKKGGEEEPHTAEDVEVADEKPTKPEDDFSFKSPRRKSEKSLKYLAAPWTPESATTPVSPRSEMANNDAEDKQDDEDDEMKTPAKDQNRGMKELKAETPKSSGLRRKSEKSMKSLAAPWTPESASAASSPEEREKKELEAETPKSSGLRRKSTKSLKSLAAPWTPESASAASSPERPVKKEVEESDSGDEDKNVVDSESDADVDSDADPVGVGGVAKKRSAAAAEAAAAARKDEVARLRWKVVKLRDEADRLRRSRDHLAARTRGLRDENEVLTAVRDEVASQAESMSLARSSGLTAAASQARSVSGRVGSVSSIVGGLDAQAAAAALAAAEDREVQLNKQLSRIRRANEKLESELEGLRAASEEATAEADIASAAVAEEAKEAERGKLVPTSSAAVSQQDTVATVAASAAAAVATMTREEKMALEQAVPAALTRAAEAERRAADAEEECEALQRALDALEKETEVLQTSHARLTREVATLRAANDELERDLKMADERADEYAADAAKYSADAAKYAAEAANATAAAKAAAALLPGLPGSEGEDGAAALAAPAAPSASSAAARSIADGEMQTDPMVIDLGNTGAASLAAAEAEAFAEMERLAREQLEQELEVMESSKRALEVENQTLKELADGSQDELEDLRAAKEATESNAENLRAKNSSLARDHSALARELAQAREDLQRARETEPSSSNRSSPRSLSKNADNAHDALIVSLKGQVESLTVQLKDAYLRELEMRKELEREKTRAKEEAEATAKEARRSAAAAGGGASPASLTRAKSASPGMIREKTSVMAKKPGAKKALALLGASLEQRYAARRRAVGILCAVSSGKGEPEMVVDEDGNTSPKSPRAVLGHTSAEQWKHARRSLASLSRLMNGPSSFMVYRQGALTSALTLMAAAPKDRAVQVAGCRVVASLVTSPHLVAHARRSPSFASGKALAAAAAALRNHHADATAARAASRAMWTAVHLGGRSAQDILVDHKLYTAVMDAMTVHPEDASVLEASCGCLLASALDNEEAKEALDKAGVRAKVRAVMRERSGEGQNMRFGGAFTSLKEWLRGKEDREEAKKQPKRSVEAQEKSHAEQDASISRIRTVNPRLLMNDSEKLETFPESIAE